MDQIEAVFENSAIDIEAAFMELKSKLPTYMMPARIHIFAPFPMNANGKTDKNALAKMLPVEI